MAGCIAICRLIYQLGCKVLKNWQMEWLVGVNPDTVLRQIDTEGK
jgi:hypothetical protein